MSLNAVTERYQKRILNDIRELYSDPAEGIFVVPDDERITILHALIVGPKDTPYESGFFYFVITYPEKVSAGPAQSQAHDDGKRVRQVQSEPVRVRKGLPVHNRHVAGARMDVRHDDEKRPDLDPEPDE